MKKIITIIIASLATITLNAQNNYPSQNFGMSPEALRIFGTIIFIALFMIFILTTLKRVFDYRLKNKIVDKGISESAASSILQTTNHESRHINIKWFALLAGSGIGLTIIYYTLPLGIHSLAIMAFSISLSFLGYYFYLKKSGN
jgi:hypothetical protein